MTFSVPHNSLLGTPLEGTKPNSVRTVSAFKTTAEEKIVGFGEHRWEHSISASGFLTSLT